MRVAVVGGNGFVGRALLAGAGPRGAARALVRTESARAALAADGIDAVDTGGLADPGRVAAALAGFDVVIHTGGVTTGAAPTDGGEPRTAVRGIVNLVEAAGRAGVERVAYFSGLGVHHYGLRPRCTNPYFLAKLLAEAELLRSPLGVLLVRPSYVFGPGDAFLPPLLRSIATDDAVEIPGDGRYRLQPIDVRDAAEAVLRACERNLSTPILDLVGPEIVTYRGFVERATRRLALAGRLSRGPAPIVERPVEEADALARAGGYRGLRPHDLDVLLCDEVSDPAPVADLLGRSLVPVDAMIDRVLSASPV